jgi:hypothetical protein
MEYFKVIKFYSKSKYYNRLNDSDISIYKNRFVNLDLNYIDGFIEYHLKKRLFYPDSALGFAGIGAIDGSCHFCTTVSKDVKVKILEVFLFAL